MVNWLKYGLVYFYTICIQANFILGQGYMPPVGIPNPDFGINETVENTYGANFYTHYVDADHPNATDTNNPFGTIENPRLTIPTSINAGSVVEVRGGPYAINLSNLQGTDAEPIFIKGENEGNLFSVNTVLGGSYNLMNTSYLIIEYASFIDETIQIGQHTDHVSFRYCDIDGNNNSTGFNIWTQKSTYQPGDLKEHLVFYKNNIHDCGLYPATDETGRFGFMIDNATSHVWILDNDIYENGDDGVQVIDRNWVSAIADVEADHIYIGKNRMHHDGENAIDVKGSTNVIISENEIYGYENLFNTSFGDAIRINDEGYQDNIWVLNNHIYDSEQGINPLQSIFRPYIIGNIIHDCSDYGINIDAGWVINNTIYNTGTAIQEGELGVANNIIVNATNNSIANGNNVHHNLRWNAPDFGTSCSNCYTFDPLFIDGQNFDFNLANNSPAIDLGSDTSTLLAIYDLFQTTYGLDIQKDINHTIRPQDLAWDLGALEYQSPNALSVGIGTDEPQGVLDVQSENSGLIIPRLANTSAVTDPVNGMIIYDLSSHCVKAFENGAWSGCLNFN